MRLELTKRTDLAFQALTAVGSAAEHRVNGAALAESLGITTHYLPHVMAPLTRSGWITSTSGPRGGYTIVAELDKITLLELVEAVEGPIDTSGCLHLGPRHSDGDVCALHRPWTRAREALISELAHVTISDIACESESTGLVHIHT
ncbi:MAG: Rrf2 family transcriptional regulator [Acidimicrobiales bacterium]